MNARHFEVPAKLDSGFSPNETPRKGRYFGHRPAGNSAGGGGPRNSFGTQVEGDFLSQAGFAGVVQWGPELAALDADGDGATNGEELGDPDGSWVQGDANPAGEVFRPWDAESTPPAPMPTAVESSGWAEIKRFVAQD